MLKNIDLVKQVLEMINTMIEASLYLESKIEDASEAFIKQIGNDILSCLDVIFPLAQAFVHEFEEQKQSTGNSIFTFFDLNTDKSCECVRDSLIRILNNTKNARHKIEFELIPLLRVMYDTLYALGLVYPDEERIRHYIKHEYQEIFGNKYLKRSQAIGKYKYDLSIVVLAYNKLEYTRLCVESILKHLPQNITYELILINHGSTDGTKEYFESIRPDKQLDLKINGGGYWAYNLIQEGEYQLMISNDVIVTENAIENMYQCISSDRQIFKVVPTTTNISNLQTISIPTLNTIEDIYSFGKQNNKYDIYRHEQRVRLCDPIAMICSQRMNDGMKDSPYSKSNIFPDDKISLLIRRNGYKSILAKDAFCFHFGSITLNDEMNKSNNDQFYKKGRKIFAEEFKIDPWGTGFCYDLSLMQYLPLNQTDHVDILGINCGIGSNPLKVRESIKENSRNMDVTIYNITDRPEYKEDLQGVGDYVEIINQRKDLSFIFQEKLFDYIIMEDKFLIDVSSKTLIKFLFSRSKEGCYVALKSPHNKLKQLLCEEVREFKNIDQWFIYRHH